MRVALVPGVLALLPEYAGLEDPVAELRAAALAAAAWLAEDGPVRVVADAQGTRIADHLLGQRGDRLTGSRHGLAGGSPGSTTDVPSGGSGVGAASDGERGRDSLGVLVVANGSARLTDASPGYVDERAIPFDDALEAALRAPDPVALSALDVGLAHQLLVGNPEGLVDLGGLLRGCRTVAVDYADAPYGVGYWVVRWSTVGESGTTR
jgi:hypothetical protein